MRTSRTCASLVASGTDMTLTSSQKVVLVLWWYREKYPSTFGREWEEGLIRFGKRNGNRANGRMRTLQSLLDLKLLEAPNYEGGSFYPDLWKASFTPEGRAELERLAKSDRSIDGLPSVCREVWYRYRKSFSAR